MVRRTSCNRPRFSRKQGAVQTSVEALFARWREHRDPRDLAAVFDRCAAQLWRVGYHLTGSRNEADDLLQATFLAAMQSAAHWRAEQALEPWLAGILANKLRMQRRRARLAVADSVSRDPVEDPADLAERAELRSSLQQRIAQLDEPYRAVLVLQLEHGLTPAEIAHALGRPRATVRSQLQRGLELLRRGLPLGLFGVAARSAAIPQLAAVRAAVVAAAGGGVAVGTLIGAGAVVMAKKLLAACLVVLVAGAGVWWAWPIAEREPGLRSAGAAEPLAAVVAGVATTSSNELAPAERSPAPSVAAPAAVTTGGLRVVVRWADATAAAGMGVSLEPSNHAGGFMAQVWQSTGAAGVAMFRDLAPGPFTVAARQGGDIDVEVQAGRVVDCELTIPEGVDVRGLVVGPDGAPVPHATIAMGPMTVGVTSDRLVAVSQADGNGGFFLRSVSVRACIAAFAASNGPSVALTVAELLAKQPVQLQVGGPRRSLRGRVVDGQGAPIEGAWVAEGLLAFRAGQPGVQIVRTDAAGNFELLGALGSNWCQLHAGALHCATWHRLVPMAEQASEQPVVIRLERGASIRGTVRSTEGTVVPDAVIRVIDSATPESGMADQRPRWCTAHAATQPDGRYRVDRIAPGLVQLAIVDRTDARVAYREFTVQPGEEIGWDAVLVDRPAFRGRLVDADGRALVGWRVSADGPAFEPMPQSDPSDAEGRFTLPKCAPAPYTLLVYAPEGAWNPPVLAVEAVVPGGEELLVRVPRRAVPSCRVRGAVTAPGAVGEVRLLLARATGSAAVASIVSGASFALGPVPAGPYSLLVEVPLGDRVTVSQVLGTWDLEPGQEIDVDAITLTRPTELVVECVEANGQPVSRAQLSLLHRGVSFHGGTLLDVIDGRATVKVLPGTYGVASYLGKECIEQPEFEIRSEERTVVPLRLSTGVWRHFRIDVPPSPLENVGHIVLVRQGVEVLRSVLLFAAKGPTEWSRTLSSGSWELEITLANGRAERFPFVVTADAEAPPIELRMAR